MYDLSILVSPQANGANMIRYSPIGIVVAILFILFGPHVWFFASDRANHTQVSQTAVSSILPDANSVGDQPRHSMVDAVETKQGWVVRTASGLQLHYELVGLGFLLVFGWPMRKYLLSRRQDPPDGVD